MTDKHRNERILEDLKLRGLEIGTVIGVDMEKRKLIAITYHDNGTVSDITQGDNVIELFGKASAETRALRPLYTVEVKQKD